MDEEYIFLLLIRSLPFNEFVKRAAEETHKEFFISEVNIYNGSRKIKWQFLKYIKFWDLNMYTIRHTFVVVNFKLYNSNLYPDVFLNYNDTFVDNFFLDC